jgi:hypothetical protein
VIKQNPSVSNSRIPTGIMAKYGFLSYSGLKRIIAFSIRNYLRTINILSL